MTHPLLARRARLLRAAALLPLAALLSACVAKTRYDEATSQVQYYQRLYQDLEAFQGKLEAENARLEGELQLYRETGTIEAGMTRAIDERMAELERMAGSLGAAPGDVTVLSVEGGYGLRLSDAILFESGSAEVLAEGRELLGRMAKEIAARPFQRVWVRGHTDSDPVKRAETVQRFPHGNLQLSAARAIEVAAVLREAGIASERIVVAGFGPNDPVVPNDNADHKQRNRRVDIFVIEDGADLDAPH